MKRILWSVVCCLCCLPFWGQTSPEIQKMEQERVQLEEQIKASKLLLNSAQKNVEGELAELSAMTAQIRKQKAYIAQLDKDVKALDCELDKIAEQMKTIKIELDRRCEHYAHALQQMSRRNTFENKLLFLLSSESFHQMALRSRYLHEYSTFQREQGESLKAKQQELEDKQKQLEATKVAKQELLKKRIDERKKLSEQEKHQHALVDELRKKEKSIRSKMAEQQAQRNSLNKEIDRLIREEIAAEEARLKKKEQEQAAKNKAAQKTDKNKTENAPDTPTKKKEVTPPFKQNESHRKLTGSFKENKGKFPVPVTGPYLITGQYGINMVPGLRDVKIDNQGVDIRAQKGAKARAIFNGEVSFVYEHTHIKGSHIVMVRHGSYISVYCNIDAKVRKGEKVKTGETIGYLRPDASGNYVMQFQLRENTKTLNPSYWIKF